MMSADHKAYHRRDKSKCLGPKCQFHASGEKLSPPISGL